MSTDRRKPETVLQAAIVTALEQLGFHVERIQSGRHRVKGGYLHCASNGTPDLKVLGGPWLEVKRPGELCTAEQFSWAARARALGEKVFVVRSVAEALGLVMA